MKFTDVRGKEERPIKPAKRKKEYLSTDFEKFKVSGLLVNGTRFQPILTTNYFYANSINVYRGSLRGYHKEEKRWIIIKEMFNY
jgi:hypothetical protein